jgi:hypothetical protein
MAKLIKKEPGFEKYQGEGWNVTIAGDTGSWGVYVDDDAGSLAYCSPVETFRLIADARKSIPRIVEEAKARGEL